MAMNADEVMLKKPSPTPVENPLYPKHDGSKIPLTKSPSPMKEIWDWPRRSKVMPYVVIRDLNADGDKQEETRPKPAAEVGIKISF